MIDLDVYSTFSTTTMMSTGNNSPPCRNNSGESSDEQRLEQQLNTIQVNTGVAATNVPIPKNTSELLFGPDFVPEKYDVICARGKYAFSHSGNIYFRELVDQMAQKYASTSNKAQRTIIVSDIVDKIRSLGNGFIKQERDGTWYEVGDAVAREKTGALFRNALSSQYKSSTTSKKKRRVSTSSKVEAQLHHIMLSNDDIRQTLESMRMYAATPEIPDELVESFFTTKNLYILDNLIKPNNLLKDVFLETAAFLPIQLINDEDSE